MHATGLVKGLTRKEYASKWWKAHPDKLRAKWRRKSRSAAGRAHAKRNRLKHAAEIKVKKAAWQKKRKQHLRAYLKSYYEYHREKLKERARNWYRDNEARHRVNVLKRRGIEAAAPLQDLKVISAWIKQMRHRPFCRCHWCGTKVHGKRIHFDHVVPLSKGGRHSIGNLCVSCSDCNLSKRNRVIADWLVQGQTFLSL